MALDEFTSQEVEATLNHEYRTIMDLTLDTVGDIINDQGKNRKRPRKNSNIYEAVFEADILDGYQGWKFKGNRNPGGRGSNTKVSNFKKLEIIISGKKISIPFDIKSNLLDLLKDGNTHYLDCRRFAGHITGVGNNIQGPLLRDKEDITFTPGKAYGFVKFKDGTRELKNGANGGEYHFFVYLGNDLFIGKPGRAAEITIANYSEMVKGFQQDYETLVEVSL